MNRHRGLDYLRIFAAVWVLSYHWSGLSGYYIELPNRYPNSWSSECPLRFFTSLGFLGVDIFFILSGAVIAETALRSSALKFITSRYLRIFPTYFVATALSIPLILAAQPHRPIKGIGSSLVGFAIFPGGSPIIGTAWTLIYECRFYVAILILIRISRKRILPPNRLIIFCYLWLALLMLAYWVNDSTYDAFVMRGYGSYFVLGILLSRTSRQSKLALAMPGLLAATILSFGKMLARTREHLFVHNNVPTVLIVLILTMVIIASSFSTQRNKKPKTSSIVTLLAQMTYPIYLLHEYMGISVIQILWRSGMDVRTAYVISFLIVLTLSATIVKIIDPKLGASFARFFPPKKIETF